MAVTENQVIERLKTVIDPEIGINIVDLGLVYNLEIEENKIRVTMTLTTPGCPMHNSMPNWVKESLSGLASDISVEVNLVWQPLWSPDKMSETAKRLLGF